MYIKEFTFSAFVIVLFTVFYIPTFPERSTKKSLAVRHDVTCVSRVSVKLGMDGEVLLPSSGPA